MRQRTGRQGQHEGGRNPRRLEGQWSLLGSPCGTCAARGDCSLRGTPDECLPAYDYSASQFKSAPLTPTHPHHEANLSALNNLALPREVLPLEVPRLPEFIVQPDLDAISCSYIRPWVAIPLDRFVSPAGDSYVRSGVVEQWRSLGVQETLLVATHYDDLLEAIWPRLSDFVVAVAESQVTVTTSLAYSIYDTRDPYHRRFELCRSLKSFEEMTKAGIPTIPSIGFAHRREARWLGEWVDSEGVSTVFFDLQLSHLVDGLVDRVLPEFLERAHGVRSVVVNGIARPERVLALRELVARHSSARVTFICKKPYQMAIHGEEFFRSGDRLVAARSDVTDLGALYEALCTFSECTARGSREEYVSIGRRHVEELPLFPGF